jgi:hypothetical protein
VDVGKIERLDEIPLGVKHHVPIKTEPWDATVPGFNATNTRSTVERSMRNWNRNASG